MGFLNMIARGYWHEPPPYRWEALAQYNSEIDRGLVHTPEWDEHMAQEQAEFDNEMLQRRTL